MRLSNLLLSLCLLLTATLGAFTVYLWFGMLADWSFNTLLSGLWVPAVGVTLFAIYAFLKGNNYQHSELFEDPQPKAASLPKLIFIIPAGIAFIIALAMIALGIDSSFLLPWCFLVIGFVLVIASTLPALSIGTENNVSNNSLYSPPSYWNSLLLAALGAALVGLYLFSNVSNADDTHFVSYIVSLLQHPNSVMFSNDVIFNEGNKNFIFALNYGQSWEALTAVIHQLTGIDYLAVYYFYLPSLFLFFTPIPLYYFTKIYFPQYAVVSVSFALVLLVCWSTYNHLHGFFFLPRFFQGKAILLSLLLPTLFLVARQFLLRPSLLSGALTGLILIACGGSSSTGLYISILVLGLCYLSFTPLNWRAVIQRGVLILLLATPNLAMTVAVKSSMGAVDSHQQALKQQVFDTVQVMGFEPTETIKEEKRPTQSMYWLFGDHYYLTVFILMFVTPLLIGAYKQQEQDKELIRFYTVLALFAFNHPLAALLTKVVGPGNLVWRFHWIIPMGLIFSLFAGSILNAKKALFTLPVFRFTKNMPQQLLTLLLFLPICAIALLFYFISSQHLAKSFSAEPITLKVNNEAMSIAKYIVKNERDDDVVLADDLIAELLPMLQRKSTLISSRPLYWSQPYFNKGETKIRQQLQYLINNMDSADDNKIIFLHSELERLRVTILVYQITGNTSIDLPEFNCEKHAKIWNICTKRI
ncbi:DUF6077 domain-containing protein [Alteromonadaceae bacterium BrNp21-10]|nr:DUF6077 domain-containing protein [Alteromonadaceae bacterium BrNp21-10]